jgi:hypothetical protein
MTTNTQNTMYSNLSVLHMQHLKDKIHKWEIFINLNGIKKTLLLKEC